MTGSTRACRSTGVSCHEASERAIPLIKFSPLLVGGPFDQTISTALGQIPMALDTCPANGSLAVSRYAFRLVPVRSRTDGFRIPEKEVSLLN
jgi:hypothetical protein